MKKILSLVLAILLLASATCLVGCFGGALETTGSGSENNGKPSEKDEAVNSMIEEIGGASETFVGALSEETYSSAEEAAHAYIAEEVVGEKEANIITTVSNGTLSTNEIKEAGIPDSLLNGADAVEELEITYTVTENEFLESGITLLAETLNKQKTVKVYVIKYGVNWQYFTPRPVTGQTISKTYYDSVFNVEKYKNCTFKNVQTVRSDVNYSGSGESGSQITETKVEQLLKYADNKIYMEIITSTYDSTQGSEPTVQKIYAYLEDVDGSISCYVKQNDSEWMMGSLYALGFSSLDELTPFYDQYLDYTYFTKTDYGFSLSDENATSYIDEVLGGEFTALLEQGMKFDMLAKYVVQEGVLSALISDAKLTYSANQDGMSASMEYVIKGEMTCTDYGTTVVEKPFTE